MRTVPLSLLFALAFNLQGLLERYAIQGARILLSLYQ